MKNFELTYNQLKDNNEPVLYKGEVYTFFDEGLTRKVFVNSDNTKVIKFLLNDDGRNFNKDEYDIYYESSEKELLAVTNISDNEMVIEQEFVLPIKFSDKELSIKDMLFAGSCRNEVGWNSEGKLVCFDLSEYKKY